MATKTFKTAALIGLASFLAFTPLKSKSQEYAYIPEPKANLSETVKGMTFLPIEHQRSYDTNFASETSNDMSLEKIGIELEEKRTTLGKLALARIERNYQRRFNSGPARINNTFTFFSLPRDQIKYNPEEYSAHIGQGIFRDATEEALRNWGVQTFGIGGSLGETIGGFSDSYTISSPFRADEGDPGTVYNGNSRWHLSFKIWDDHPEVSFKHHMGLKNQLNVRASIDGAEIVFVRPDIFPNTLQNVNFVAGAKLTDYDYGEAKAYLGLKWKPSDNEEFNLGATLNNHLNMGNPVKDKNTSGGFIGLSYSKRF